METFIKRLDYLSPHITFYHKSFLSHSSIISGILSIISIILIIISVIYFSLEIIEKKEPKIFSFNSFINDSGYFPMNASSLFHFISIATIFSNNEYDGVDFGYFRIIGFEELFDNYLIDKNLNSREHWLYGKCNNETDTEGIAHLVNYDYFERSACIREYFNPKDQKYYDTGDPKFRWPEMAHGTYNKNYKIYNLIIEKCQEDTINYILGENSHCKNFLN